MATRGHYARRVRSLAFLCLLLPAAALADDPRQLQLEAKPVSLLQGDLRVRPLRGSKIDAKRGEIVFDWGTARFTLVAYATELAGSKLRAEVVADLPRQGVPVAGTRIERLAVDAPVTAYEVAPYHPRANELLYAAYLATPDGHADVLAFYVDDGGIADASRWLDVAREIARTASGPPLTPLHLGDLTLALPPGSSADARDGGYEVDIPRLGFCTIIESPSQHPAQISGHNLHWDYTTDPDSRAWATIGNVGIDCHAENENQLARLRSVMETLRR